MVSLAESFSKEGYKGTFVLLEPITEGFRATPKLITHKKGDQATF